MKPGEHIEIGVRDSGRGMDAQTCARVFEPFFTTKNGGTGLGLYIVHGSVQRLRGRVEVDSELGRGTTTGVLLPVHSPSNQPHRRTRARRAFWPLRMSA